MASTVTTVTARLRILRYSGVAIAIVACSVNASGARSAAGAIVELEETMPKYLFEARYSSAGAGGIAREGGVGRRAAARRHLEELGGKLESMYFAFGEVDCFLIADLPDNASAGAFSLAGIESGAMVSRTIVLMTPEELDNAVAKKVDFRAPGQ
jgi:uncharacterized protein with GYD domain